MLNKEANTLLGKTGERKKRKVFDHFKEKLCEKLERIKSGIVEEFEGRITKSQQYYTTNRVQTSKFKCKTVYGI